MNETLVFQRSLSAEYLDAIGYQAMYLHGNPVLPVIPVVTNPGGVMIVGAYPTAKFATIGKERDVPVADIDAPFANQTYFDGANLRSVRAGEELEKKYLGELGLTQKNLWLTNLVKVFLFKEGHAEKYRKFGRPVQESRSKFPQFAKDSIPFLTKEITIARPKLIILLGEEVSKSLVDARGPGKNLFDGKPHKLKGIETSALTFCLPHPGIVMRPKRKATAQSPDPTDWNAKLDELLPVVKAAIDQNK